MTSIRGKQYISDTDYASKALQNAIVADHDKLSFLSKELSVLSSAASSLSERFDMEEGQEDFDPIQLQFRYVIAQQKHHEASEVASKKSLLQQELQDRYCSLSILSGALIQIAKQGISVVYGSKSGPAGIRQIAGQQLHAVIWEARNQSMHYEEGNPYPAVVAVFNALQASHGDAFSLTIHHKENLAYEVVKILGWDNNEQIR